MDFAHTFSKTTVFFFFVFFNKDYTFYTKNLFIRPKNCFQSILYKERCKKFRKNQFSSNIFTFLIVTHQNFEYNLRILANFGKSSRKNLKIYLFRPYVFKKGVFFYFLIKIMLFTLKIYSFGPKIAFKSFFTTKDAKSFVKINFLVKIFTFLSVIRQNFEYNLRILANIGKFSCKNSKIYGFRPYVFKKLGSLLVLFNRDYSFYTKNLFIRPK